jgi:hypothetical protein
MTRATRAFLLGHFLASTRDISTVLYGMRTGATLSKLPADHPEDEILSRLKTKDVI